ncbi:MAG: hypothetical protein ACKVOP_13500 [Sphingomonadaceae bacterium]
MNTLIKFGTLAVTAAFLTASIVPAEAGRVAARNGKGSAAVAGSANGNVWARGRAVTTSESDATTATSGGAFKAANGAWGARASQTTVNPDGSATRRGGFAASGARGSVASEGSAARNADGTYSGSRATTATNAATGNTYKGSTTYDSTNGVTRSATCTDATGNTIACPR